MAIPLVAAAAIPSIVKGIGGIFDIFGGNRRARRNVRPVAQVNENYLKNVALAEQMGRQGLPQQQYNLGLQNINRNQSAALGALSRSANPNAGLQGLLRASNDATMGLDVQNANARLNNQRFAFGQRNNLANEQQRVFDWNQKGKYLEEAQAASQQINAGKQNAMGGLTDLSVLGQQYLASEGGQPSPSPQMQLPQMGYRGIGRQNPYGQINGLRGY